MRERTIFLSALEKKDAAARAAYLDVACAGQPLLRQRLEELLRSHGELGGFLDVPAMEQLAAAEQSLAFLGPSGEPGSLGRLDHYEVLEVVGRGAAGIVLRARDTKLQRVVAVKVLAPRLAASPAARQRFVREAQAAAAVRDDHVVAIHAVHEDGPAPYLVMEYIDGVTLEARVKKAGALGLTEVLRIGMQLATGLAAAHAQGVVHRDVKPGNVLLENHVQRVKITDFGLARAADETGGAPGRSVAGTPAFMSPEQARGEPTDHRTDLFSLGSVLYTLCAGRPPFSADTTAALLRRVREDTPADLGALNPDVPDWLAAAIRKLHAKAPGDRFVSAREVADLLGARLATLQAPAPALRAEPAPAVVLPRRRGMVVALILAGLLAILGAVAVWLGLLRAPAAGRGPGAGTKAAGPLDLRREDVPPLLLALAGGGDPAQAPPELAAVLGDGRFLLPHVGQTAWMEQSPDGKLLAVPLDEDVALFDARTGAFLRSLKGPGGRTFFLTFSRDSRQLAATTRREAVGGAARVWDLAADRVLYTNPLPGPVISCAAAFSPDGKRLCAESGGRLHVWDARSGRPIQDVEGFANGIASLCFSPDGRRLAVTTWTGDTVKVHDCTGDKFAEVRTLGHPWPTTAAVYSPDGNLLASSDLTGFKLWDARTLGTVFAVEASAERLAFAPDGRTLFAATTTDQPKAVHAFTRWDVESQKQTGTLSVEVSAEPVRAFHCLSRDGKILFVVPQHGATWVRAIDAATGKERFPPQGHVAAVNAVAVSPDGRSLASAGDDRAVKIWDLASGRVLHSLAAHNGAVWGLAFSPDGKRLASGSIDGTIALWDVDSGAEVRAMHGYARTPSRLRFSPDGRALVAGGEDGTVRTWEVFTGKEGSLPPMHAGQVRCVACSPDGRLLASGGEDKIIVLHDLSSEDRREFTVPEVVNELAFSPEGRSLAAVGDGPEAAVRVWDLETGAATAWRGHTGAASGLAFAPQAPLLASGGDDGTVVLWDRAAGASRLRTFGPGPFGGGVRSVAFTPDGRYLATANANGTVYLLRVGTPP